MRITYLGTENLNEAKYRVFDLDMQHVSLYEPPEFEELASCYADFDISSSVTKVVLQSTFTDETGCLKVDEYQGNTLYIRESFEPSKPFAIMRFGKWTPPKQPEPTDSSLYELLAEECVELAHAALKYARWQRGEQPIEDTDEVQLMDHILEEFADVEVVADRLELIKDKDNACTYMAYCKDKAQRWKERMSKEA